LIIGADGIRSVVRSIIGIQPDKTPSEQSCLHANVSTEQAVKLGLVDYSQHNALEYWGGQEGKWDKIVLSPCNGGKLLSYYCFFSRDKGDYSSHTWGGEDLPVEQLLEPYPELDSQVLNHLKIGEDIRPWRLWVQYVFPSGLRVVVARTNSAFYSKPYSYIHKSIVCLLGDAGHPVRPPFSPLGPQYTRTD
jgi:salicylate hydroxylase